MTPGSQHWVVLGPGAISGLIASGLCERGEQVSVLSRRIKQTEVDWHLIRSQSKAHYRAPVSPSPIAENSVFIVAVKAFDVISALQHIMSLTGFRKTMPIVLSHNGMVELPEALKELNLHPLVTTHGAVKSKSENGTICIEHRGVGRSWLEAKTQQTDSKFWSNLQQAYAPLILAQDLSQKRWLKLIINCVINPLTAIHQCANGELLNDTWQSQIYRLVAEAVAVANSQSIPLMPDDCYQEVLQVIQETQLNHSSMLQDIRQQRHTEIQQLTGYLIKTGKSAGIATPTHQALLGKFWQRYGS